MDCNGRPAFERDLGLLIGEEELCQRLGITPHQRLKLTVEGRFPKALRLGDGDYRWSWLAVCEWLKADCPVTDEGAYKVHVADEARRILNGEA